MDQSFHYLSMISQALFQKEVLHRLADLSLSPGQPKVLDYLGLHDGSIQKKIAYGCQIDQGTLTGILERMEDKGLIERKSKKGDRRSSYVYLTAQGKLCQREVMKVFAILEEDVFVGITKEEQDNFMNVFYKICSNLTDTEELQ